MHAAAEAYIVVLERRLDALIEIAAALQESQTAIVAMDLEKILRSIAYQEDLCAEIHSIDRELAGLRVILGSASSGQTNWNTLEGLPEYMNADARRKLGILMRGFKSTQEDVKKLNRIQAELLRCSRRSVNMLINLTMHFTGDYGLLPAPVVATVAASARK